MPSHCMPCHTWRIVFYFLCVFIAPSDGQFTATSSFIPSSGVRSSVNNHLHNRRFNIREGESFTILCGVQNPTQPFIAELYLDGRSIVITDGLLPDTTYSKTGTNGVNTQINLELTFNNFQAVHNGRYDCFANTSDGSSTSFVDSRLYGTGPITVTLLSSQYQILYSDEDISIPTQIRGEFYDIYWIYHPTDPLLDSGGRETLIDGSGQRISGIGNIRFTQQLVITQGTTPHVAGYYAPEVQETVVTRRTIMADESVLVRAYASPTASLPAVDNQSPGADLTVTCTATGYPEPTISFSTSDISASSSTGEHVRTTTATPSTVFTTTRSITFSGLLATDCGMVTCTASNADRDGTQTVTVTTQIQVISSPDVSITPSADQAIFIRGSLTLSCEAEDCTTSSFVYMWYRDGFNVENGTSLSISGAFSSDFGRYECNVTGDGGTGSAVIYISEQNSLTLTSELSAAPNPSLSTVEGSSVDHYNIESQATFSMSCTFESPNNFDLEGSKDGFVLSTDPPSTSTLSSPTRTSKTLTIQLSSFSTSDNGVYQCNASNSDRNLLSRRVLLIAAVPPSIAAVSVRQLSSLDEPALRVSWQRPISEVTISRYEVGYKLRTSNVWTVTTLKGASSTSATIRNVALSALYDIRVRAISTVGPGAYSQTTGYYYSVPSAPHLLWLRPAVSSNSAGLTAQWRPAGSERPITGYLVQYRRSSGSSGWQSWAEVAASATNTTIDRLEKGTRYRVRVAATSDVGTGLPSAEIQATTYGVPFLTEVDAYPLPKPGSVRLTWTRAQFTQPAVKLQGYSIQYRKMSEQDARGGDFKKQLFNSTTMVVSVGDTVSAEVHGLNLGDVYDVKVALLTNAGIGEYSELVNVTTYPDSCSQCSEIRAVTFVTFQADRMKVSEEQSMVLVDVYRQGPMETPLTLRVKDVPGTAKRGSDYLLQSRDVVFLNTDQKLEKTSIVVRIRNDEVVEQGGPESFTLVLYSDDVDSRVVFTVSELSVSIKDDD